MLKLYYVYALDCLIQESNFTPKLLPGKLNKLELNKKHPLTFVIGQE